MDFLEYPDIYKEDKGSMNPGRLKLTNQGVIFKNSKTGKVDNVQGSEVETIKWQRLAASSGVRILMKNGAVFRFGGFADSDNEKLTKFFKHNFDLEMKNRDLCLKGWNWGTAKFQGNLLSFNVDKTTAFEIPLHNVSHCATAKNEVTLELHQNDDAAVSLMELRFHIPSDATQTVDAVQAFHENIMSKASIIQATGDAIAVFKELQCLTPRGRYDIKMFPTFIQLHGKTFDYKIPLTTVLRLFLLPHKDGRQMYFVLSLDPPIKQGQTRYHFLILLFNKDDETTISIGLSEEDIKDKYEDKLQKEMSGPTFEVLSRIMKALVQRKITVPGSFSGHSGTNAITCSYRAGNGLLYPLERGLIYIHKPPVHIRFDEISTLNFARSGGSTRSFDIEVETKSGVVHTFSSIEKEEYGKLFDFATSKKLRIKNRTDTGLTGKVSKKQEKPNYNEEDLVDSDLEDEPDAYLQRVKAEGRQREEDGEGGGSSDESSDESFNPGDSGSEVAEEFDSNAPSSSESNEEGGTKAGGGGTGSDTEKKKKKKKSAKTVKEPGMRKKRAKKEVEEGKPKRPQSAYFLWLGEIREQIKKENPGISITDLSKKAGEMWKDVKDKTKWEKLAQEGKKEYEKAMAEFKASGGSKSPNRSEKKQKPKKESEKNVSPTKIKSKEYISSESSSGSEDEKPLKAKKTEPKKTTKKEPKKPKSEDKPKSEEKPKSEDKPKSEEKPKSEDDNEDEEMLSTPPSSDKDEDMEEDSD